MDEITLTKQIVKHGNQSIIILPKILGEMVAPKTLVEVRLRVIKRDDLINNKGDKK